MNVNKPKKTSKLREIRERVHLTQHEMADRLHMSQPAYSNLELEESHLKKEVIVMLIKEFGAAAADILDTDGVTININAENNTLNGTGAGHFYNYPKELVEKMASAKNDEITYLKSVIEKLLGNNLQKKV